MSKFFLKSFKAKNKCWACKEDKLSGYSLCEKHLTKARNLWRSWGFERRQAGLCISCDRTSFKGWLRCKFHTLLNRKRCAAWMKEHPGYYRIELARKQELVRNGQCPKCASHRKVSPGHVVCWFCKAKETLRRKYGVEAAMQIMHERYGTRFDRKLITAAA